MTATETFQAWAPIVMALGVLAVSTMRAHTNFGGVGFAGLFFMYAAFASPFGEPLTSFSNAMTPALAIRSVVLMFGIYCVVSWAIELNDDETEEALE